MLLESAVFFCTNTNLVLHRACKKEIRKGLQRFTAGGSAGVFSEHLFCRDMTTVTPNMDYVATLSARNKSRSRSRYLATRMPILKLIGLRSWIRDQPNSVSSELKYLNLPSFVRQELFGMRKIRRKRGIFEARGSKKTPRVGAVGSPLSDQESPGQPSSLPPENS